MIFINYPINPFNELWVKDCYHMSILPGVVYSEGNGEVVLFNQYFKYSLDKTSICYKAYDYQNLYQKINTETNIVISAQTDRPINFHQFLKEKLLEKKVVVVGIDNYYEDIRSDCFLKKHSGHSVLVCGMDEEKKVYKILEQPFFYSYQYKSCEINFDTLEKCFNEFFKRKDCEDFFYNDLSEATRVNGEMPILCTMTIEEGDINPININERRRYQKNCIKKMNEIEEALEYITVYEEKFEELYKNINESYNYSIIKDLNILINNKILEEYICEKLIHNKKIQLIVCNIIDNWKYIRMILSKKVFSRRENDMHIVEGIKRLKTIYLLEKNFIKKEKEIWKELNYII